MELTLRPESEIKATKRQPGGKTSAGPPGVPKGLRLGFRALRNGAKLGRHEVVFSRAGNRLHIEIAADYVVRLGFVSLYRYRLRASEVWTGNRLQTAAVETDKNGTPEFASVERAGSGFVVEGSGLRSYRAPLSWRLATLWNPDQLKGPLISPLDGSPLRYDVAPRGRSTVLDAAGVEREADLYALSGDPPLEVWYDPDRIWTSLRARASDGSTITYLSE